jgi:hypothetical protein
MLHKGYDSKGSVEKKNPLFVILKELDAEMN